MTVGADDGVMRRYVRALRAEIARVAAAPPVGGWPQLGSVFVGGGTPTLLEPAELAAVLEAVRGALPVAADAEITAEANPETVTVEGLGVLVDAGLNRLSVGAQSFDQSVLVTLGRWHEVGATARAVDDARQAGVPSVSVDLIYGTPGESDTSWQASLGEAVALGVDHVSCYALTVEANTPFAGRIRRGELAGIDEDVQAERMAQADAVLDAAGLRRYEVSNWARPGHESRHNRTYWHGGDWLAFGASAHGHWRGHRWWNVRPTERYLAEVEGGRSPIAGQEMLGPDAIRTERLLTALRTLEGVARADIEPLDNAVVERLRGAGLLTGDPDRLVLTPAGLAVAGGIAAQLA